MIYCLIACWCVAAYIGWNAILDRDKLKEENKKLRTDLIAIKTKILALYKDHVNK